MCCFALVLRYLAFPLVATMVGVVMDVPVLYTCIFWDVLPQGLLLMPMLAEKMDARPILVLSALEATALCAASGRAPEDGATVCFVPLLACQMVVMGWPSRGSSHENGAMRSALIADGASDCSSTQ